MSHLSEILKPRHVKLDLTGGDPVPQMRQLAELLQGDARIVNWRSLEAKLVARARKGFTSLSDVAVMCHARTDGVSQMVMSAGRINTANGAEFLFLIGLPPAMASEYLRVVGALARAFKSEEIATELAATSTGEEFVEVLARHELFLS